MKKSFKQILALVLSLLMLLSLVGCGGKKDASADQKTVVFWNLLYNTGNLESDKDKTADELYINRAIAQFEEENPDIKIEMVTPSQEDYYSLLKAAFVAEEGPDVVMLWTGGFTTDYQDYLLPLEDLFSEEERAQLLGWELCRRDLAADGEIIAVPVTMAPPYSIYYNKAVFQQAGIDPETVDIKTWDDLLALCGELKAAGVTPFYMGEKEGTNFTFTLTQLWGSAAGEQPFVDIRNGDVTFSEAPYLKEALEAWKALYTNGYTNPDVMSLTWGDGHAKFLAGESAMEIGMGFYSQDVSSALGEDAGFFPAPVLSADCAYPNADFGGFPGNCFAIPKYSKVSEEGARFIKFLCSKEQQDTYVAENLGDFSNHVDAVAPVSETNVLYSGLWNLSKEKDALIGWDNIVQGDICGEVLTFSSQIMTGEMSIEDALARFDAKQAEVLG